MSNILIIGATRGLGEALTKLYASDLSTTVHATTRSNEAPASPSGPNIKWITDIDLNSAETGAVLGTKAKGTHFDAVIITAGFFGKESFDKPDWKAEVTMYTTSSIAPVFLVHHLVKVGCVGEGSKVLLVSSESGSITLRHVSEGGGNYAHHASKAALNMVGKLLSLDLKEKGVAVGMVHPGFMRTEMTKNVGFDQFWDDGGAVTPEEAAKSLKEFADEFSMDKTGQYWAPRGPRDIGTAEAVLGKNLSTPLQLPW